MVVMEVEVGLNCGIWVGQWDVGPTHSVGIRLNGGMKVSGPPWHAMMPKALLLPSYIPEETIVALVLSPNGQIFFSFAIFQPLHIKPLPN